MGSAPNAAVEGSIASPGSTSGVKTVQDPTATDSLVEPSILQKSGSIVSPGTTNGVKTVQDPTATDPLVEPSILETTGTIRSPGTGASGVQSVENPESKSSPNAQTGVDPISAKPGSMLRKRQLRRVDDGGNVV